MESFGEFGKENFSLKFFFGERILENSYKNCSFFLKHWFFLWRSCIFPIFEAPSAPQKMPPSWFWCSKKRPSRCLRPPFGRAPPTTSLLQFLASLTFYIRKVKTIHKNFGISIQANLIPDKTCNLVSLKWFKSRSSLVKTNFDLY